MTDISDAEHGEQVRARLAAFDAATPGTRERAYAMGRIHAYASDDLARLLARAEAAEAALAVAWQEGRESLAADFLRPTGLDGFRPSTPNPYQPKRADHA